MVKICEESRCTGCGLCSNICPKGAISMVENGVFGHFTPAINDSLCVNCGLCQKKCPSHLKQTFQLPKITFAAWRTNKEKLKGSSSGGIAAALYEAALEENYVVVGAALNDQFGVELQMASSLQEAERFKGSKYIQADSYSIYHYCRQELKKGKKVLFIGTPCQCAAMRSAADEIAKADLVTVDLVCHGVPSQRMLREYISSIEHRKNRTADRVSFRSSYGEQLTLSDEKGAFWSRRWKEDDFLFAFQTGMFLSETCYHCIYARAERTSDLTIGDFWNIGREVPFERPNNKVSVVAVNTERGLRLLNCCKDLHLEERSYQEAVNGNANLRNPSVRHPQRDDFLRIYLEKGISEALHATVHKSVQKYRMKKNMIEVPKKMIRRMLKPLIKWKQQEA